MTDVERRILRLVAEMALNAHEDSGAPPSSVLSLELRQALVELTFEGAAMRRALDVLERG